MTQKFRKFEIYRCSWDIVAYNIDQYGQQTGDHEVLESFNTFEEAKENLPKYAVQNKWNKSWHIAGNSYREVSYRYNRVLHSTELRAYDES